MPASDPARLAVYAAPAPGSPLAERAERWLLEADDRTGIADLTTAARHYGFHGTLVPPFRAAPAQTRDSIHAAVAELAARHSPVVVPALVVGSIGRFAALVPRVRLAALDDLAAASLDGAPFGVDSLCVFEQPTPDDDFSEVARYPLLGGA